MPRTFVLALALVGYGLVPPLLGASEETVSEGPTAQGSLQIPRLTGEIQIDAHLGEDAWEGALEVDLPWQFQPQDGVPAPVETHCLLGYSETAFYLGCRALDPEPQEIRAHLTDRDTASAFGDDWIGVILDTFHDQRRGYELFVNPLGVQLDLSRSETGGGNVEDASWDAIWDSAGRLTAEGYVIEMAIPFAALSFQRTQGEQTWGIVVLRNYPRSVRRVLANAPLSRDRNCTLCQLPSITGFAGVQPGRDLEITPTVTATRTDSAVEGSGLGEGETEAEAGLTASWGVTPNLNLGATVNPDFSQVEADSPQLDVNERFALFFPEKRPFFLEGADYFQTFFDLMHTRNIADPEWGARLTGKVGRHAIGVVAARDAVTNLLLPGSQSSDLASLSFESTDAVVRYRLDFGESSTVGALLTSREGDGYHNQTGGFDLNWRPTHHDEVTLQVLGSSTQYPDAVAAEFGQPVGSFSDEAWQASYGHSTEEWFFEAEHRDVGTGFRADLGFMPQVDFRASEVDGGYTWWGEEEDFYTRIDAFALWERVEDQEGNLLEREVRLEGSLQGPLQSRVEYGFERGDQAFQGVLFEGLVAHDVEFAIEPSGALELGFEVDWGDTIDVANVRPAEELVWAPFFTLRPGRHLRLSGFHARQELEVAAGRLFTAAVSELVTVYQFNVRTFVRLIAQRRAVEREVALYLEEVPAESERLLGQLLFSYTINPRTVLYLGVSEQRAQDPLQGLEPTDRAFFLKLSYAWLL